MERIEAHRSCYRRALSLFKEECGSVMTCCFTVLLSLVLLLSAGYCAASFLPNHWAQILCAAGVMLLLFFGLVAPFWIGIGRWFYNLPDRRVPLFELFHYFQNKQTYARAVRFALQLAGRLFGTLFVASLPALFLEMVLNNLSHSSMGIGVLYSIVMVIQALSVVAGVALALYHLVHYFLAGLFFYEQPETKPLQCLRYSYDLMHGRRFDVLMLILSLFPIYLTWVLVLPVLFTIPYLMLLCTYKSRELMEESLHTT